MNILSWFENKTGRTYPANAKTIINYLINNKNIKIEFVFQGYWEFEVLDFNELDSLVTGKTTPSDREDYYSNPYFLIAKIEEYIKEYFPNNNLENILPFAREVWGDRLRYIIFCSNSDNPILLDIDSMSFEPRISNYEITKFIPVDKLAEGTTQEKIKFDTRDSFSSILNEQQYFFDIPDGIYSVMDYEDLLQKSLELYRPQIDFHFLPLPESDDKYVFNIDIEGFSKTYSVDKASDYVDSNNLVLLLNDMLKAIDTNTHRYFISLRYVCDFGIAFVNDELRAKLLENGFADTNNYR